MNGDVEKHHLQLEDATVGSHVGVEVSQYGIVHETESI